MKIFECGGHFHFGDNKSRLIIAESHEEALAAAYGGSWVQTSSPEAIVRVYCHADDTSKYFAPVKA